MKHPPSIITVVLLLLALRLPALSLTLPVAEDTSSATSKSVAKLAGRGTTLPVHATRHGLMRFDVGSFADTTAVADVKSARLIVYFSSVSKPGAITIHRVTQDWSERIGPGPQVVPAFDPQPLATIAVRADLNKQFVVIDVSGAVRDWLTDPFSDFGFALVSQEGAHVRIGSKEGPGVGYPATLDIDVGQPALAPVESVGGVSAASVAAAANLANAATNQNAPGSIVLRDASGNFSAGSVTGSFVGNGAGLTNVTAVNGVTATSLANLNSTFMEFVRVGNPGNPSDTADGDASTFQIERLGAVSKTFLIGKYEVTNAQYVRFLNAVAAEDPNYLYNPLMEGDRRQGILRSGDEGNYSYSVKPHMENKPVIWVNYYDAVRFCNWLHNGMPIGRQDATTTEDGAYLVVEENYPSVVITRKPGARAFVPTEDEWYKAAYYDPTKGGKGGYYLYPTCSDDAPAFGKADPTGNLRDPSSNVANYNFGADWNGEHGNVTAVGSGGPGSESAYGAADLAGNVFEWCDTVKEAQARVLRGGAWGSWITDLNELQSTFRYGGEISVEQDNIGFRVAKP